MINICICIAFFDFSTTIEFRLTALRLFSISLWRFLKLLKEVALPLAGTNALDACATDAFATGVGSALVAMPRMLMRASAATGGVEGPGEKACLLGDDDRNESEVFKVGMGDAALSPSADAADFVLSSACPLSPESVFGIDADGEEVEAATFTLGSGEGLLGRFMRSFFSKKRLIAAPFLSRVFEDFLVLLWFVPIALSCSDFRLSSCKDMVPVCLFLIGAKFLIDGTTESSPPSLLTMRISKSIWSK